jgi:Cu/Ag efflux protein CusF
MIMLLFVRKYFIALLLFVVQPLTAQVKFSAALSANEISKNEMVQLRLAVENAADVQNITPPSFSNFIVVSGPNQESGMTAINGVVKQYVAVNYILKPKGPGTFTITSAGAKADGKDYRSNAVTIKVNNTLAQAGGGNSFVPGINPFDDAPRQQPFNDFILRKGENAADKINRNMFVKLQTNKTTCFVGEPVVATYKLYTRLKSESNLVKNPSFSGFSVVDLQQPDNINYTRETVNGREYNVYIIRKVQLYPLQTGILELDAVELENNVQFIKEAYARSQMNIPEEMLNEFADAAIPPEATEIQKVILQSKPVTIHVKPLPVVNVPASFKGATGNFVIKPALEKNTFTTDDAGRLNIVIEGSGNLQLITTPDVNWPNGVEAFEPSVTDDFTKNTVPVSGRKIISYNFTAAAAGNYVLPPVAFSYFSPEKGKYITDSTPSLAFSVTKGTGKKVSSAAVTKEEKSLLNKFFSNRRWVVSSVAILIILGVLFWLKSDKRKEEQEQQVAAVALKEAEPEIIVLKEEKNYLEKAAALIHADSTAYYKELNFALKDFLADKLQQPAATLNKKTITEELDKRNVHTDTVIKLQNLMSDIELQLYAPFAEQEKMEYLYNNTAGMIQLLEIYKI